MPDWVFADLLIVYDVALFNTFDFGFTFTFLQVTVNTASPDATDNPDKVTVLPLTVSFWSVKFSITPVVLNDKL